MKTTKHLLEAVTLASESAAEDGTWRVKVISEGKGSSGTYTAELLENHHHALDDLLSFKNHPTGWDGPETRDFTMITGEVVGETWVDTDERGLKAVYANYLPDPEYRDKLARYKDKLGLSIYIEGSGYIEESTGEFIVDWLNPADPYASLDVVIAPGARGKFMENMRKSYEARENAISEKDPDADASAGEPKERKLRMEKDVEERFAALETLLTSLVAKENDAKAEAAQAEADADAGRKAVEAYDAAVAAIDKAELPKKVTESLRAQAKEGKDVTADIANAVAIKEALAEDAKTTVTEGAPGRSLSEGGEYKLRGFGGSK